MDTEIFHILEIDLPLGDGTSKRFWYGSISSDDGTIKMSRIEDLKNWEDFIYKRSEEIITGNPKVNKDKDVIKINMGSINKGYESNHKKPYILM